MAEPIIVSIEANDPLGLYTHFIAQDSITSTIQDFAKHKKVNGDYDIIRDVFDEITIVNVKYTYSNETGLGSILPFLGQVYNEYMVTNLSVESEKGKYPIIEVVAHKHTYNNETTGIKYAIDDETKSKITGAVGAYDLLNLGNINGCIESSTFTMAMDHAESNCPNGKHWKGANTAGIEVANCVYLGNVDEISLSSNWKCTDYTVDDGNADHNRVQVNAEQILTRI